MLYPALKVITPDFLEKTINGLLLIFDENEEVKKLGWINEAKIENGSVVIALGLTVSQKFREQEWKKLDEEK